LTIVDHCWLPSIYSVKLTQKGVNKN